jgi:hypothetical protein
VAAALRRNNSRRKTLDNNSIDDATLGLTPEYRKRFTKLSEDNALAVADYIVSLKSESDSLSDNYWRSCLLYVQFLFRRSRIYPFLTYPSEVFLLFFG